MAAIDFPASPTVGQAFTAGNGVVYTWNGLLWLASGASAGGDFCASGTGMAVGGAFTVVIPATVLTGNSGGWYSTSTGRFTPPAGRYTLFATLYGSANSSAALAAQLHKNGVAIPNTTAGNWSGVPTGSVTANVQVVVDANGTDYFDLRGVCSAGASIAGVTFGAFPISGIKGPPGDLPNGLKLYSEQVCAGGETQMNVTIPPVASIKRLELEFNWQAASGDPACSLQSVVSGTPNASANHAFQQMYASGAVAGAVYTPAGTAWQVGNLNRNYSTVKLWPLVGTAVWAGYINIGSISSVAARQVQLIEFDGGADPATTTGFRLTLAASSFVAQSTFRSFVVM